MTTNYYNQNARTFLADTVYFDVDMAEYITLIAGLNTIPGAR